eukprot:1580161-Amphidinium_carterae.2
MSSSNQTRAKDGRSAVECAVGLEKTPLFPLKAIAFNAASTLRRTFAEYNRKRSSNSILCPYNLQWPLLACRASSMKDLAARL